MYAVSAVLGSLADVSDLVDDVLLVDDFIVEKDIPWDFQLLTSKDDLELLPYSV